MKLLREVATYTPKYVYEYEGRGMTRAEFCAREQKRALAQIPWWLLPRKSWPGGPRFYVTWLSPLWWGMLKWDILHPTFDAAIWLGVWELREEGGYYLQGHWRWAFWRSRGSHWHPRLSRAAA